MGEEVEESWDRKLRELENSVAFVVGDHEFSSVIRAAREHIESLRASLTRSEEERDEARHRQSYLAAMCDFWAEAIAWSDSDFRAVVSTKVEATDLNRLREAAAMHPPVISRDADAEDRGQ